MSLYAAIEKIESVSDGTIKVYGVASSESRDNDGEVIKADAIRGAIPEYMRFPAIREMHKLDAAGRALEVDCGDDGFTRVVAHVVDPVAVQKVKAQVYTGFSIGGRALERDEHDKKTITKMSMHEISLVDRPCNPDAKLDLWKADEMQKLDDTAAAGASEQAAGGTFSEPKNPGSGVNNYDLEGQKKKPKKEVAKAEYPIEPLSKRDWNQKQRDSAADSGDAFPDGSYPIKNQGDLDSAVRRRGKSKSQSKAEVTAHIRRAAKQHGLKVPEMDDTDKVALPDGLAKVTMGQLLELQEGFANLSMGELLAKAEGLTKAETEATPPDGSAKPVTDSEHSENEEDDGRPSRVGTPAESPAGKSMAVDPAAPALQSTNQNFGAGVSRASAQALHEGSVEGGSTVPAHGAGAAGEYAGKVTKGMGTMSCLASILCDIKCLLVNQRWEEAMEDENSDIIGQMETWLKQGATLLGSVVSKEVQELLEEARVDPGDAMGMIAMVAKTISKMGVAKADGKKKPAVDADTGGKHEMDADDDDDTETAGMSKVEKVASAMPARDPNDIRKIESLEKRLEALENRPVDKSHAGRATAISKAQDTVSGYAAATADDEQLLKALNDMSPTQRQNMVFKALLARPTAIINPAGQ